MDCYIVRIYRHEADNPHEFVGVVERVGTDGKKSFTSMGELWKILSAGSTSGEGKKQGRRSAGSAKQAESGIRRGGVPAEQTRSARPQSPRH